MIHVAKPGRWHRRLLLLASCGLLVGAIPAAAQTSPTADEVRQLLEAAAQARAEAAEALEKANGAYAEAQRLMRQIDARSAPPAAPSAAFVNTAPSPPAPSLAIGGAATCDDAGPNGTAASMLTSDTRQDSDLLTPSEVGGLNWFTAVCLGLTDYEQRKTTTDLGFQFTGGKSGGLIEAGPSFTWRQFGPTGDASRFRSDYTTLRLAGYSTVGKKGDAPFLGVSDEKGFQAKSGFGGTVSLERGWGHRTDRSVLEGAINSALAEARRLCLARYGVADPLIDAGGPIRARGFADALANCENENYAKWLSAQGESNWQKIVKPLWGYDSDPAFFVGAKASYGWSAFDYYPVFDTATGTRLLNDLPAEFLDEGGASKLEGEPYSATAYFGGGYRFDSVLKGGMIGGSLGLTYRREYVTPGKYDDQVLCVPPTGATFTRCRTVDIAAPVTNTGFVASAAVKFQLPRYSVLPPFAFTIRPSYAFDTQRWGLEVPLYLFTESDSKLSSGVKLACEGKGKTDEGELDHACTAALFVGTKFELGRTP